MIAMLQCTNAQRTIPYQLTFYFGYVHQIGCKRQPIGVLSGRQDEQKNARVKLHILHPDVKGKV
jgi:hypothetical protein